MPVLWTLHRVKQFYQSPTYLGNFGAPHDPSQTPWKAQLKREAFVANSEYVKHFPLVTCMQAFGAMHTI